MAKANQRHSGNNRIHSVENEYKIPIKYRKRYMGNNSSKWVSKKKYLRYIKWRKENYGI